MGVADDVVEEDVLDPDDLVADAEAEESGCEDPDEVGDEPCDDGPPDKLDDELELKYRRVSIVHGDSKSTNETK